VVLVILASTIIAENLKAVRVNQKPDLDRKRSLYSILLNLATIPRRYNFGKEFFWISLI